jgi:hypothetical protein
MSAVFFFRVIMVTIMHECFQPIVEVNIQENGQKNG